MKTATVQEVEGEWQRVLRWVDAGEEVAVTRRSKTIAKIVPVRQDAGQKEIQSRKAAWVEHRRRLTEIYGGNNAPGKLTSDIIVEGRR